MCDAYVLRSVKESIYQSPLIPDPTSNQSVVTVLPESNIEVQVGEDFHQRRNTSRLKIGILCCDFVNNLYACCNVWITPICLPVLCHQPCSQHKA